METCTALLTIVSLAVSSVTHLDVSDLACGPGRVASQAPVGGGAGSTGRRSAAVGRWRAVARDRASALLARAKSIFCAVFSGDHGTRSNKRSIRRVLILPPDRIRTLPFGTGVTLLRSAPPIVTDLRAWPTRPDATQLGRDRGEVEALLRRPADT